MKAMTMNLIQACDKAFGIITRTHEINRLYLKGIQCIGEGKLRSGVMSLATEAIRDEKLSEEVLSAMRTWSASFAGSGSFLLVEVAGVEKDKLKALAQKAFDENAGQRLLH